jgi:hypothetical protein
MTDPGVWNKVSLCKQRIPFSARFPKCSVSSGNRARFQRPFCSVDCWDARLSVQRHRSAHASETVGPRGPARIDQASGKLPASFRQASGKLRASFPGSGHRSRRALDVGPRSPRRGYPSQHWAALRLNSSSKMMGFCVRKAGSWRR